MTPYYNQDGITIYCADNRDVLPTLGRFDLLLTDPPYGIGRDNGMGGGGFDGFGSGKKRNPKRYDGEWDDEVPDGNTIELVLNAADLEIIWGGNYFSGRLPQESKWLVWDKQQTMPSYSDAELAWTNLNGNSVKMFRYCGAGLMAKEKDRCHSTQKPVALMSWCLILAGDSVRTVLDPWMGSGTTLVAAKLRGLQATGIEINEDYCKLAVERLRQGVLIPA